MAKNPMEPMQFKLRLRRGMHDRLAVIAKKNCRTLNGELVHRLERSFGVESAADLVRAAIEAYEDSEIERQSEKEILDGLAALGMPN